ncbi:MAG: signal peptidase I [Candidatus Hadarchaeales archaeon]
MAGHKRKRSSKIKNLLGTVLSLLLVYSFMVSFATLAAGTTSFWMSVVSDSMSHKDNPNWRVYFENREERRWLLSKYGIPLTEDVLRTYDTSKFPVKEGFQRGDLIIVKGVSSISEISVGDVIVMRGKNGGLPMTHRVLAIWQKDGKIRLITKGDHNPSPLPQEREIQPEDIIGKVVYVVPKLGWPSIIVQGR